MSAGTYEFAGRKVSIHSLYDLVYRLCRDYRSEGEPDICVTITPDDIRQERQRSARQDAREGRAPREFPEDYLETLAVYRKIAEEMLAFDTLLMHGSAIAVDGEGYLFTAKSGTGKSTHTRLWREVFGSRAVMVNDDKPLIRAANGEIRICGTPWDGKHHLSSNIQVPLKAICILQRGEANRICQITPSEALPELLQQSYRPQKAEPLLKALGLLDSIGKQVRFYRLQCNMDPAAARLAYEGMQPKQEENVD